MRRIVCTGLVTVLVVGCIALGSGCVVTDMASRALITLGTHIGQWGEQLPDLIRVEDGSVIVGPGNGAREH